MTTEYWLQKKTIGGWSTVTWYVDQEQAQTNYDRLRAGIGYSYRLVSVETVQEHLLDEVVTVEAPVLLPDKIAKPWGTPNISNGWGDIKTPSLGWNEPTSPISSVFDGGVKPEHGLSGSVWVVHHGNKHKARVSANELDEYLNKGYERAGPRTQFRE